MNRGDPREATLMPNWRDAGQSGDFVQLYESDAVLVDSISDFIRSGLQSGAGAIVMATQEHLHEVQKRWWRAGFDFASLREKKQLVLLDAVGLLEQFLIDGEPDRDRFFQVIGTPIAEVAGRFSKAVVYSEMVTVLWQRGASGAAVLLDELWYALGRRQNFTRFSAYPLQEYTAEISVVDETAEAMQPLVVPPGNYSEQALRVIGYLQHRASALRHTIDEYHAAEHDSALLAAVVESSEDAIVTKTLDGHIRTWNTSAERIFGYTAAEAVGKPITLIIPPDLYGEEQSILARLRRAERIEHFETERVTKDGRRIHVSLSVSPIRNARGEVVGAAKTARDISARKQAQEALRLSEQALREAHRHKDDFLATLAHELRNPLAPIRYAVAAMRKPGISPPQREHAQDIVERQLEHMSRLLDDLLDMARVTHNTLALRKRRLELASVIGAALETARPALEAKGHTLTLDLPKEPVELDADPVRLAQVFSNLLINAAKYTNPRGRIQLHARREHGCVVVSIRDNGIGMAPETLPNLFTLFSQANTALERAEGGLGIGLALVRGLVSLHGGSVEARSAGLNSGSEFIVRLPIASLSGPAKTHAADDAAPSADTSHLQILIADDNRDGADSCATLLELSGHHVRTAYSGRQALEFAEEFRPQVILLDIGMPELNGYDVAQRIRAAPWGQNIVLVAVTGWGQEEDKQRALTAGFDRHLTKPIDPGELENLLQNVDIRSSPLA
jgi:PAS domain S-box-containing protein